LGSSIHTETCYGIVRFVYSRYTIKIKSMIDQLTTTVNNRLKISDLPSNYSAFGGKGDVWGDTAHIYKSGEGNLCGRPALSSNWVRMEGVEHIGCPTCLAKYNS
jgi:hypothetical protein